MGRTMYSHCLWCIHIGHLRLNIDRITWGIDWPVAAHALFQLRTPCFLYTGLSTQNEFCLSTRLHAIVFPPHTSPPQCNALIHIQDCTMRPLSNTYESSNVIGVIDRFIHIGVFGTCWVGNWGSIAWPEATRVHLVWYRGDHALVCIQWTD